jgi:predicted GH43/DUF377 family glycosyl hydrolase
MRTLLLAATLFATAGCGRYSDFTLPASAGQPRTITWRWEPSPDPVLMRGDAGQFDSSDALNPSVVRARGLYFNFYSGFDGKSWHTGRAISKDGLIWTKSGRVLSPDPGTWEGGYIAANGHVLEINGEFFYWYQAGDPPRIGLARSKDGIKFEKHGAPVLETGPRGSWDERGAADPFVVRAGNILYMFYLGQDRAHRQRLGVAVSSDGVVWNKLRSNPILELGAAGDFDEKGLGEPAVWSASGYYWMLYTGRDGGEMRRMGMACSRDGVHWLKLREPIIEGVRPWDSKVVCDATPVVEDGLVRVWFGGGDVARPDERLNGQIGFGVLRPADAKLTRE